MKRKKGKTEKKKKKEKEEVGRKGKGERKERNKERKGHVWKEKPRSQCGAGCQCRRDSVRGTMGKSREFSVGPAGKFTPICLWESQGLSEILFLNTIVAKS